jgi:hypothetical protein
MGRPSSSSRSGEGGAAKSSSAAPAATGSSCSPAAVSAAVLVGRGAELGALGVVRLEARRDDVLAAGLGEAARLGGGREGVAGAVPVVLVGLGLGLDVVLEVGSLAPGLGARAAVALELAVVDALLGLAGLGAAGARGGLGGLDLLDALEHGLVGDLRDGVVGDHVAAPERDGLALGVTHERGDGDLPAGHQSTSSVMTALAFVTAGTTTEDARTKCPSGSLPWNAAAKMPGRSVPVMP